MEDFYLEDGLGDAIQMIQLSADDERLISFVADHVLLGEGGVRKVRDWLTCWLEKQEKKEEIR